METQKRQGKQPGMGEGRSIPQPREGHRRMTQCRKKTPSQRSSIRASLTRRRRAGLLSRNPQRPGLDVNRDCPLCHGRIVSVSARRWCPDAARLPRSTVPCPSVETILNYEMNDTAVAGPWNCRAYRTFLVEILPGRPGHFCIFSRPG